MSGRRLTMLVVATGAIVGLVTLVGFKGDDRQEITAVFENASGLRLNSDVRVAGVPAGSVTGLEVDDDDRAVATLRVERSAGTIGEETRAAIRPANLLGEKYVELELDQAGAPLRDGGMIPVAQTSTPVELDDLLAVLDPSTAAMLGALVNEAGIGFGERGLDLRALLATLPDSLDHSRALIRSLAQETDAIASMVRRTDRLLAAVGPHREELGDLVASAAGAFGAVAEKRVELAETVHRAPAGMRRLRETLERARAAASRLSPAALALTAAAPALDRVLEGLPGFVDAAVPTLERAQTTAGLLERLGEEGAPLVSELRPVATQLAEVAAKAAPTVRFFDGPGITMYLRIMEGWAQAIQVRDGPGHLFRNQLVFSEEIINALVSRYLRAPVAPARRDAAGLGPNGKPAPAPDSPDGSEDPGNLPGLDDGLGELGDGVDDLLPGGLKDVGGPNGQPLPIEDVLDFLLEP